MSQKLKWKKLEHDPPNPDDFDLQCPRCGNIQNLWDCGDSQLYCLKCDFEEPQDPQEQPRPRIKPDSLLRFLPTDFSGDY